MRFGSTAFVKNVIGVLDLRYHPPSSRCDLLEVQIQADELEETKTKKATVTASVSPAVAKSNFQKFQIQVAVKFQNAACLSSLTFWRHLALANRLPLFC